MEVCPDARHRTGAGSKGRNLPWGGKAAETGRSWIVHGGQIRGSARSRGIAQQHEERDGPTRRYRTQITRLTDEAYQTVCRPTGPWDERMSDGPHSAIDRC